MPRTCHLCGCTDDRPCLGGAVYASTSIAAWVQRLIDDPSLLAPGEACRWATETELGPVCSAHTVAELEGVVRILDPDEAMWGEA